MSRSGQRLWSVATDPGGPLAVVAVDDVLCVLPMQWWDRAVDVLAALEAHSRCVAAAMDGPDEEQHEGAGRPGSGDADGPDTDVVTAVLDVLLVGGLRSGPPFVVAHQRDTEVRLCSRGRLPAALVAANGSTTRPDPHARPWSDVTLAGPAGVVVGAVVDLEDVTGPVALVRRGVVRAVGVARHLEPAPAVVLVPSALAPVPDVVAGNEADGNEHDGNEADGHEHDGHEHDGHEHDGHEQDGHEDDAHEDDGLEDSVAGYSSLYADLRSSGLLDRVPADGPDGRSDDVPRGESPYPSEAPGPVVRHPGGGDPDRRPAHEDTLTAYDLEDVRLSPSLTPAPAATQPGPAGQLDQGGDGPEISSVPDFRRAGARPQAVPAAPPPAAAGQGPAVATHADPYEPTDDRTVDRASLLADVSHTTRPCPAGHENPPGADLCARCGARLPVAGTQRVVLVLTLPDGRTVDVDRPLVLGRHPRADRFAGGVAPELIQLVDPTHTVSGTHLEVRPDGEHVRVRDLGSRNGTVLDRPGAATKDLGPELEPVTPGCVLVLGGQVTISFREPGR